jgi:hypothetical protein
MAAAGNFRRRLRYFCNACIKKTAFPPDRVDDGRSVRGRVVDISRTLKTWRLVIHD